MNVIIGISILLYKHAVVYNMHINVIRINIFLTVSKLYSVCNFSYTNFTECITIDILLLFIQKSCYIRYPSSQYLLSRLIPFPRFPEYALSYASYNLSRQGTRSPKNLKYLYVSDVGKIRLKPLATNRSSSSLTKYLYGYMNKLIYIYICVCIYLNKT